MKDYKKSPSMPYFTDNDLMVFEDEEGKQYRDFIKSHQYFHEASKVLSIYYGEDIIIYVEDHEDGDTYIDFFDMRIGRTIPRGFEIIEIWRRESTQYNLIWEANPICGAQ